jgi:hypothetical protein
VMTLSARETLFIYSLLVPQAHGKVTLHLNRRIGKYDVRRILCIRFTILSLNATRFYLARDAGWSGSPKVYTITPPLLCTLKRNTPTACCASAIEKNNAIE